MGKDREGTLKNNNRNTNKGRASKSGKKRTETGKKGSGSSGDQGGQTSTTGAGNQKPQQPFWPQMLPGIVTKERFSALANFSAEHCITIITDKAGSPDEHKIQFRNHLSELRPIMRDRGMAEDELDHLLQHAEQLLRNEEFWIRHQSSRLAFFIAPDMFEVMVLGDEGLPTRVIDKSLYVTPLLPCLKDDHYFFINVVSKKGCKLFRADKKGIEAVPVKLPGEVEDVKDVPDKNSGVFRAAEGGSQEANIHGTGEGGPDDKTLTAIFFEAIDDVFWKEVLHDEHVPLVLAGVEYVLPIYRSVSDYKFIWDEYLTGSREQQDPALLYADAMKIMKPYFEAAQVKALENYGNLSGTGKTSDVVAEIIPAAYYARVSQLFVCKGELIWGQFHEESNQLELGHSPDEGGEDLIDHAVVKTFANGGEVFLLDKEQMPSDAQMAAIFRY